MRMSVQGLIKECNLHAIEIWFHWTGITRFADKVTSLNFSKNKAVNVYWNIKIYQIYSIKILKRFVQFVELNFQSNKCFDCKKTNHKLHSSLWNVVALMIPRKSNHNCHEYIIVVLPGCSLTLGQLDGGSSFVMLRIGLHRVNIHRHVTHPPTSRCS